MVCVFNNQPLFEFNSHYAEIANLARILDAMNRLGGVPVSLSNKADKARGFHLEVRVGGLCSDRAHTLVERIRAMPGVISAGPIFQQRCL